MLWCLHATPSMELFVADSQHQTSGNELNLLLCTIHTQSSTSSNEVVITKTRFSLETHSRGVELIVDRRKSCVCKGATNIIAAIDLFERADFYN